MNCQHRCSSSSSFYTDDKNLYATFPPIYELLGHLTHNFQLVLAHGVSWDLETSTDGSRSRVEDLSFDSPNIKKFNVSISVIRSRCMSRWDKQFQVYMKKIIIVAAYKGISPCSTQTPTHQNITIPFIKKCHYSSRIRDQSHPMI